MTAIDSAGLKKMFDEISTAIETERDHLCVLDGAIGDADHGIAMALGFGAVRDALAGLDLSATVPTRYSTSQQSPSSTRSAPHPDRSMPLPSCAPPQP